MDLAVFIKLIGTYDDTRTAPFYKGIGANISAARTAVQTVITENGTWLNNFCKGDLTLLNKTGYPLEKDSVAQGKLDQTIVILSLLKVNGSIGFLISHLVGKTIKYGVKYTLTTNLETNPAQWEGFFYAAGQRDGIIADLTSKAEYKFSSFGMGTDRDITYSEPVIITPQ